MKNNRSKSVLSLSVAMFSVLLSFSAFAAEKTFEIGTVLGKGADAFEKVLGTGFTVRSSPGSGQGRGYYARNAEVPGLGLVSFLTDNGKEDGAIQNVEVYFTDKQIITWQAAFSKLGITSKLAKGEGKENLERLILPPIGGKTWIAAFYAKGRENSEGRPTLLLWWETK